jgi:hypothetical protein
LLENFWTFYCSKTSSDPRHSSLRIIKDWRKWFCSVFLHNMILFHWSWEIWKPLKLPHSPDDNCACNKDQYHSMFCLPCSYSWN